MKPRRSHPAPLRGVGLARRRRGAVALEYIIIAAVIGLGIVGAFKAYARSVRKAINHSVVHPGGVNGPYDPKRGVGGALSNL